MIWRRQLLAWLERASGIGYRRLPPLHEEPERKDQVEATKRVRESAVSLSKEMIRLEEALRR
jgi:hypothetical protein